MARLIRAAPELMVLMKGMAAAARSVFFTLLLLTAAIYIFGIVFVHLTADTEVGSKYFGSVVESMLTLLLRGTYLDEITELIEDMKQESVILVIIFLVFVLLAAQTLMNMLIGVLCEVVSVVANAEKEERNMNIVVAKLGGILHKWSGNQGISITKQEFVMMLHDPEATTALQDVGVDAVGLADFVDLIFEDADCEQQLSFEHFMDIILQFRGSNTATVKDLVESQRTVRSAIDNVGCMLCSLEDRILRNGLFSLEGSPPPSVVPVNCGSSTGGRLAMNLGRRSSNSSASTASAGKVRASSIAMQSEKKHSQGQKHSQFCGGYAGVLPRSHHLWKSLEK